jgi:hypothetical protein
VDKLSCPQAERGIEFEKWGIEFEAENVVFHRIKHLVKVILGHWVFNLIKEDLITF